jgi:hypothetical protein
MPFAWDYPSWDQRVLGIALDEQTLQGTKRGPMLVLMLETISEIKPMDVPVKTPSSFVILTFGLTIVIRVTLGFFVKSCYEVGERN